MKSCNKCAAELPITEFYQSSSSKDGHQNTCKRCIIAYNAAREARLSLDPEWRVSELRRHREKSRRYRETGRAKPVSPESKRAYISRYHERHPEKHKAHTLVRNAIQCGRLRVMPCEVCGNPAEAHHDDYAKPLEVRWLCPCHHAEHHANEREAKILQSK